MTSTTVHNVLSGDTNLHVNDTGGSGRPVVLIHGWPLSGESWSEQVPALAAAGYRVITYDRRGFGRSDKPTGGYDYDTLTSDLEAVLAALEVTDATLVGFSMGGGEIARIFRAGDISRIRSVVFASAVPPFLAHTPDNPDGPLQTAAAEKMAADLTADDTAFYDEFMTTFFSAGDELVVSEEQRQTGLRLTAQADKNAALETMVAFGTTDFRDDLTRVTVPTLVVHGDSDGVVPFEGSGKRTFEAIPGSSLSVIVGGPHGINVSHAAEFNAILLEFLKH